MMIRCVFTDSKGTIYTYRLVTVQSLVASSWQGWRWQIASQRLSILPLGLAVFKVVIHLLSLIFLGTGSSFHSFSMTITVTSSTKCPEVCCYEDLLSSHAKCLFDGRLCSNGGPGQSCPRTVAGFLSWPCGSELDHGWCWFKLYIARTPAGLLHHGSILQCHKFTSTTLEVFCLRL